jgi:mycothiol synthase
VSAFPPPQEPEAPRVDRVDATPDAVRGILALADRAREADGPAPFNEQTRLTLGAHDGPAALVVRGEDDRPVGAAVVARGDGGAEAELVVDPAHRRRGVGRALLAAVLAQAGSSSVSVWAHGDHPGARALATATGLDRARELLQLRASVAEARAGLGERPMPAGLALSSFSPDDADDWVALPSRAA